MPKLKLRGWQFGIIAEALQERFKKECLELHKILCDALGENFDIAHTSTLTSQAFDSKKAEALAKHERLRDIYQAKIDLFEAEHRGALLTVDEQTELAKLQTGLNAEESIIERIEEKFESVHNIEVMANIVKSKVNDNDIIKKYDDDPKPLAFDDDDNDDDEPYPPNWNWGD